MSPLETPKPGRSPLLVALVAVSAAALLLAVGCGGTEVPPRAPGSALWVSPESRPLDRAEMGRLEGLGIRELFVEAGSLEWGAEGARLEPSSWYAPSRRVRATLVVNGRWLEGARGVQASRALAPALEALVAEAERRRVIAVGIHFDLEAGLDAEGIEEYGRFLDATRRQLGPGLAVSATLPASWLEIPQVRRVTAGASFVVPFLYGHRQQESEEPAAWDLRRMEESLRAVDDLGKPFLLGVVTSGAGAVAGPGGERIGSATGIGLHHLAWNPGLEPLPGVTLQALDRQVYSFEAKAPVRLAGLAVPRGSTIRLVGTSTAHLSRVLEQAHGLALEHYLGEVFYRLPAPGDEVSLETVHLQSALSGGPTVPAPEVTAKMTPRPSGRWLLHLSLENLNAEASSLSLLDHNYAEVTLEGGVFGTVDAGDYYRWDLLASGAQGELVRSLRRASVLRLYAPVLASGARLESGPVEIYFPPRTEPRMTLSARFLGPYGQEATFGPVRWVASADE